MVTLTDLALASRDQATRPRHAPSSVPKSTSWMLSSYLSHCSTSPSAELNAKGECLQINIAPGIPQTISYLSECADEEDTDTPYLVAKPVGLTAS